MRVIVENFDTKTNDNPFFDPWTASVSGSGEKMTVKMPIKSDLPPNMMMHVVIDLDGNEIVDYEGTLCAGLEDETIGKGVVEHGLPKEMFPKKCPIKAGADWEIHEWVLPIEKLPPGIPDGPAEGVLTIFEEGKAPIVTITVKGKIMHKLPGMGR
ncbi:uncharacterized protein LOC107045047 isoform X2 [Diachasma alloeum]|nr:uncharacterized protein LOC107045047 isoform X2 [Diachasma alloeum]